MAHRVLCVSVVDSTEKKLKKGNHVQKIMHLSCIYGETVLKPDNIKTDLCYSVIKYTWNY